MLLSAPTARAQSRHAVMITLLHLARRLSPVPGERKERSHHNSKESKEKKCYCVILSLKTTNLPVFSPRCCTAALSK